MAAARRIGLPLFYNLVGDIEGNARKIIPRALQVPHPEHRIRFGADKKGPEEIVFRTFFYAEKPLETISRCKRPSSR